MPRARIPPWHELGHVLGLYEEHQNPNSGIVWDEEAVYALMTGPPNHWTREQTQQTILRKGILLGITAPGIRTLSCTSRSAPG